MQCRILPGFVMRELVALHIKVGESSDQKDVIVCAAYIPSDSGAPLSSKNSRN